MSSGYQSRLVRIEAGAVKRNGSGLILVFADAGDDDAQIDRKIAEQRRMRGLRADDQSAPVVVLSWADQQVL